MTNLTPSSRYSLNDGNTLPVIGFGTYPLRGATGIDAVTGAIEAGYRLIDSALNYENEREVGEAVRRSGLDRADLQLTSKLPGRHHGFEETLASFEQSRTNLAVDYLDLYLIHWPNPSVDRFVDSFKAMIKLQSDGLVRSVGVSNFTIEHLTRLHDETGVWPSVNQVQVLPLHPQAALRAFHEQHRIITESWGPLGKDTTVVSRSIITDIAEELGVTPSQVILRWHLQLGLLPLPKSGDPARQRENLDVFGFELTDAHLAAIATLESDPAQFADPNTHEEM
ncbi:MAG: aldo/keto reductase [Glaciihabitans sp.]|nr:aldo/keto reductase [Glaciihabitans sp.]